MSDSDQNIDWELLHSLRDTFLNNARNAGNYWKDEWVLDQYHRTFAARIGWKWKAALADAKQVHWKPRANQILDWGCGTGIATLSLIEAFGSDWLERVFLWDHSVLACQFAKRRILEIAPHLKVETFEHNRHRKEFPNTLSVASHVINELPIDTRIELRNLMADSAQVFWVEPGNYESSRLLSEQRSFLLDTHHAIAPCTHCLDCPMLAEENTRHWCHFFGRPPIEAFTDSNWSRFSQVMEIDLRSLPYSFIVMDSQRLGSELPDSKLSRIIGRAKQLKGHARILSCRASSLSEYELQKRANKTLWKTIKKERDGSLYYWDKIETGRILEGAAVDWQEGSIRPS